ncbi:hypothetical protein [Thermofilum sp.]|uniref:hypothetical protein n=1 Tax=Thermofilum sp. TaxID=1961369 RepID=UPI00316A7958
MSAGSRWQIRIYGKYRVLGKNIIVLEGGLVTLTTTEGWCSWISQFSVFASVSQKLAEDAANGVLGLVAVPLDEVYAAESGRSRPTPEYAVLRRFIALPLDYALGLAEGESMPVDSPEVERAAELMQLRGIARVEGGFIRLVSEDAKRSIMRQVKRIMMDEEAVLKKVLG